MISIIFSNWHLLSNEAKTMDVIRNAIKVWNEEGDKRAMNWFLLRTPTEVLGVIGIYVAVAKVKSCVFLIFNVKLMLD